MSQYTSQYPRIPVDSVIKAYFEEFYKLSDTPDAHEAYTNAFTEDATLIMASKKAQGRSGNWTYVCTTIIALKTCVNGFVELKREIRNSSLTQRNVGAYI